MDIGGNFHRSIKTILLVLAMCLAACGSGPATVDGGPTAGATSSNRGSVLGAASPSTSCVYQSRAYTSCGGDGTAGAWAWRCNDEPCAQLSLNPYPIAAGDCWGSTEYQGEQDYPGTCADWTAAGEPLVDGGTAAPAECWPPASLSLVPQWHPPATPAAACSASQLDGFLAACAADASTKQSCDAFTGDPTNGGCTSCLLSQTSAATWGPLTAYAPASWQPNVGGCVALVDAADAACGTAEQAFEECIHAACDAACLPRFGTSSAAYQGCQTVASDGVCAAEWYAAQCMKQVQMSGRATVCNSVASLLRAFCY